MWVAPSHGLWSQEEGREKKERAWRKLNCFSFVFWSLEIWRSSILFPAKLSVTWFSHQCGLYPLKPCESPFVARLRLKFSIFGLYYFIGNCNSLWFWQSVSHGCIAVLTHLKEDMVMVTMKRGIGKYCHLEMAQSWWYITMTEMSEAHGCVWKHRGYCFPLCLPQSLLARELGRNPFLKVWVW